MGLPDWVENKKPAAMKAAGYSLFSSCLTWQQYAANDHDTLQLSPAHSALPR
jgi:hypothetical protein